MATKFTSVRVEGWRQFGHVELKLHPRLTVLTGANGAGKSSLLKLFTRHFGFDRPFLSTPVRTPSGGYSYITGLFSDAIAKIWQRWWTRRDDRADMSNVGSIIYANGVEAVLQVPRESGVQYNVSVSNQQPIAGIHIDSHSPISSFQQVGQIPTTIIRADAAYNNYNSEIQSRYQGGSSGYSPTYRMKEAIIAMAMFGEGNTHVQGNADVLDAYRGYVRALHKMLPESLGFIDLSVRPPEVVLVTRSGEFLIDAASGGVMTILDITWRLHMFSLMNDEFVVTIDEPENHLHPTMQRSLMRRLLSAFPSAQFIIATHSPFMVSSIRDSNVYVLRYRRGHLDGEELVVKGTGGSGGGKRIQIARARVKQWTPRVERRFLKALLATCNVTAACAEVGMTPASAYAHRKRWPRFAALWDEAIGEGFLRIEVALIQNAQNLFSADELPPETVLRGIDVKQAIHLVHMHKHGVLGLGKAPGVGWRPPPTLAEVKPGILKKLWAFHAAKAVPAAERAAQEREYRRRRG